MEKAPIWISVYDRPKHFRACIESLSKNNEAKDTILYISSDGPTDALSAVKVAEVREYIKNIIGFKKIISFMPVDNTNGEIKIKACDELRTNHRRYIHTEDDNIFSPMALDFLNSGLDIYEEDEKIIAVSAYMYPGFPLKGLEQIFLQSVACWGVALWRDKDLAPHFFDEASLSKEVISDNQLFQKINQILPNTALMIQAIAEGRLKAGDVTRSIMAIKHDKYSVHPSLSLVRNMGNDGSGEHCGVNDIYSTQEICHRKINFNLKKPIEMSNFDKKWVSSFHGGKFAQVHGKLVYFKFNSNHVISRNFFSLLLKTYDIAFGKANSLVHRLRKFLHQNSISRSTK